MKTKTNNYIFLQNLCTLICKNTNFKERNKYNKKNFNKLKLVNKVFLLNVCNCL